MVADLEDIAGKQRLVGKQGLLGGDFGVTHQQNALLARAEQRDKRAVVQRALGYIIVRAEE